MSRNSIFSKRILKSKRQREYRELMEEILSSPAVKYIAAGLAAAALARIANKLADEYPEISTFIKENRDNLEEKMRQFKKDFGQEQASP